MMPQAINSLDTWRDHAIQHGYDVRHDAGSNEYSATRKLWSCNTWLMGYYFAGAGNGWMHVD